MEDLPEDDEDQGCDEGQRKPRHARTPGAARMTPTASAFEEQESFATGS
ncbi:hypothetical protein BN2537_2571 [Streptomyces venezuelae]|nr:hypothetical protein BN2537_2571 [Streptomyces venezuelae]